MKHRLIKYMTSYFVNIRCKLYFLLIQRFFTERGNNKTFLGGVCVWGGSGYLEGRWCNCLFVADSEM